MGPRKRSRNAGMGARPFFLNRHVAGLVQGYDFEWWRGPLSVLCGALPL